MHIGRVRKCERVLCGGLRLSGSGGTYLVVHESVHMCMSGECVRVREFCVSLRLSGSGGTYPVAHESVHICISGECVSV